MKVYNMLKSYDNCALTIDRIGDEPGWYRIGSVKTFVFVPKGKKYLVARVGGGFTFFDEFLAQEQEK